MKAISLSLLILSFVWQLSAQTQISYHEYFFDNRMAWTEYSEEDTGLIEVNTEYGEYIFESHNEKLIVGQAAIKINAQKDFSYAYNFVNNTSALIGLSGNSNKISFEINYGEKYRIAYSKNGKNKTGKWKKLSEQIINSEPEIYSLKIEYNNHTYHFYYNGILVADIADSKIDQPAYYTKLEIGSAIDLTVTDVFIDAEVFLTDTQDFLKCNGISKEELAMKKFYSLSEITNITEEKAFLDVYKIKIDKYDYAWDKNTLPEEAFNCINLQQVEISARDKGSYAEIIGQLQNFQYLQFLGLIIDSIPETIGKLKNLRNLFAGNWTSVSNKAMNEICKLKKLTYLDLGTDEPYGDVPFEGLKNIGNLTNLEYLDLSFNKLGKIPEGIFSLIKLITLDIGGNDLSTISTNILKLENLEYLYINDDFTGTIPESVFTLSKLKYIDLSRNYLKTIPEGIFKLKNLEYLDLYGNYIPKEEIEKIKKAFPNIEINE